MAMPAQSIETEALSLSVEDRTRLVVHLLESIEQRPTSDATQVERAWISESNRRYQAYLRGEEEAIPVKEVFSDLWADDH